MRLKIALALARFASKAQSAELRFGNRSTVVYTNLVRKAARK